MEIKSSFKIPVSAKKKKNPTQERFSSWVFLNNSMRSSPPPNTSL